MNNKLITCGQRNPKNTGAKSIRTNSKTKRKTEYNIKYKAIINRSDLK